MVVKSLLDLELLVAEVAGEGVFEVRVHLFEMEFSVPESFEVFETPEASESAVEFGNARDFFSNADFLSTKKEN